ncbi:MAG: extracellular solute-binding protein [Lachnospiraceae bacterium]|nr:extracellular solute-binding protein [Lachnospiraceae bacterium]
MKKLLAILLAALMVISMAACNNAGKKDEKVEITFICAAYSTETEPFLKKLCENFEKENENVKVNLEVVGWDTISDRIAALVGAGQAPDIFNGDQASEWVPDGLVYEVEDIISKELKADFYQQFWNNNISTYDGKVYSVPYLASVRALYCNKKIMDAAGAEVPKTWDDVYTACEKIKAYDPNIYAWGIDATTTEGQTMIAYYGWSNGGGYVDANDNWILNSEGNVGGYEFAYDLYQKGYTNQNPSTDTRDNMQALVNEGKMAMLVTACFFPALYPDLELEIGAIPYNAKTQTASSTLGVQDAMLFFNEKAKGKKDSDAKKEALKKFADYFYAADNYVAFMIQEGMLPATQSGVKALAEKNPDQAAYLDVLAGAKFYARNRADWVEGQNAAIQAAQEMFAGQKTPKQALDDAQAKVQK